MEGTELERYLPAYDFSERHQILIPVEAAKAYQILKSTKFSDIFWVRLLLKMRGISTQRTFEDLFTVLADNENREVVWGLIGKPWTLSGSLIKFPPGQFLTFDERGFAKVAWNFLFTEKPEGTLVSTETRIFCTDPLSCKKFRMYWAFIRPFSGFLRKQMLNQIATISRQRT